MKSPRALSEEGVVRQLNDQYIQSLMHADMEWYRAHLADDFLCIESNGSMLDKTQFLRKTVEGPDLADYRLTQVQVRIYGDVALVHGQGSFTRRDATTGTSRYTDVYLRDGNDWKVIAAQVTRTLSPRRESFR